MPLITVIIPTYNRSSIILESLKGAMQQTINDIEILVCDDGSTDDTHALIEKVVDHRVRFIPGEHSGHPSIPRNMGIKVSDSEYIAFLDSDDIWLPSKLERQLGAMKEMKVRASCTNAFRFIPNQGIRGTLFEHKKTILDTKEILKRNYVVCSSAMVHRTNLTEAGGFPENIEMKGIEDYITWLKVSLNTSFGYIQEPQVIYRDDEKNSFRGYIYEKPALQRKKILNEFRSWAKKEKNNTSLLLKLDWLRLKNELKAYANRIKNDPR